MDGADRQLEDTLDLIAEASGDRSLWGDVAGRLMTHTRAAAGAIYVDSRQAHPGIVRTTEFAHLCNYVDRWVERYFHHYAALNPYLVRPELQISGRLMTERSLGTTLTASEQEFIADWQEPQGFHHVIAEFLHDREEGTLTLVFWRDRQTGSASEREAREFGQLARAANRAVRIGDRLRRADAEAQAANAALDHLGAAIVTIGHDGRVRSASPSADTLMASRDGVTARNGRLATLYPQDQPALDRLLDDILDPARCVAAEAREIRLQRDGGRAALRVSAVAIHKRLPRFGPDDGAAAVLILRAVVSAAPRLDALVALWGLTPAEARLALQLLRPLSLTAAAAALGVTYETARSHLKNLFAKTGTHGQTELVVRLMTGFG